MMFQPVSDRDISTGMAVAAHPARRPIVATLFALVLLAAFAVLAPSPAWSATFLERAQQHFEEGDLQAAEVELKNALQRDPTDAAARFLLGKVHLQKGDAADAEKEFVRAQELGYTGEELELMLAYARLNLRQYGDVVKNLADQTPGDSALSRDLTVARGEALMSLGQFEEAAEAFDRVLSIGPHVRALVNKARLAVIFENPEEARTLLDQAIAIDANDPFLVTVDAEWYFRERRFEEAKQRFARAVELDSTQAIARLGYIQTLVALRELEEAHRITQNLLEARPSDLRIILQSSVVHFLRGNFERAKEAADRVLASNARNTQALVIAGFSAFQLGQFEQARARLTNYLSQQPQDTRARGVLGAALLQLGHTDQAYKTLDIAEDEIPQSAEYLGILTDAAIAARDQEAALKRAEQLAALRPDDAMAQERLGRIRLASGDVDGGIAALERSLAINPAAQRVYVSLFSSFMVRNQFERAMQTAQQAQEHLPEISLGYGMAGAVLAASGQMADAEAAFRQAVAKDPADITTVANLARLLALDDRIAEARAVFDDALSAKPDDLDLLMRYAAVEERAGHEEEALGLLRKAVASHPESAPASLQLSNGLLRTGRADQALDVIEAALVANPGNADLIETKGRVHLQSEDWPEAVRSFQQLRELRPSSADVTELYALALEGDGRLEDALRAIDQARGLGSTAGRLAVTRTRLLIRLGRIGPAQAELASLKQSNPDAAEVSLLEGQIALAANKPEVAEAAFEKAFAQTPNNTALRELSKTKFALGKQSEAEALLRDWLDGHPGDLTIHQFLAAMLIAQRDWERAETQYRAILNLRPEEPGILNNLAMVQLERDAVPQAVANARKAVSLAPGSPALADTLGVALLRAGEVQESVSILQAAREAAPESGSIGFHLAQALAAKGDVEAAVATLQEILRSDRRFGDRNAAEALLASLTQ